LIAVTILYSFKADSILSFISWPSLTVNKVILGTKILGKLVRLRMASRY